MSSPDLSLPDILAQIPQPFLLLLAWVGLMWLLEIVDWLLLRGALDRLGIRPRQLEGLWGVVLAPLLHGGLRHLATNTLPLLVLGGLILFQSQQVFVIVTAIVWLSSGLGVWLLGANRTNHLGASGVVFGFFGFLLLRGYFERSVGAIALSVLVGLMYGSMIWGVLPLRRGVSSLGHLCGFVAGVLTARYLTEIQQWVNVTFGVRG